MHNSSSEGPGQLQQGVTSVGACRPAAATQRVKLAADEGQLNAALRAIGQALSWQPVLSRLHASHSSSMGQQKCRAGRQVLWASSQSQQHLGWVPVLSTTLGCPSSMWPHPCREASPCNAARCCCRRAAAQRSQSRTASARAWGASVASHLPPACCLALHPWRAVQPMSTLLCQGLGCPNQGLAAACRQASSIGAGQ